MKTIFVSEIKQKVFACTAMIVLLIHVNSVLICGFLFTVNRESISAAQCEKKVTNCGGKCFLAKMTKNAIEGNTAGSSQQKSQNQQSAHVESEYIEDKNDICLQAYLHSIIIDTDFNNETSSGYTFELLIPPRG